jgi:hypothetical protein
VLTQTPDAILAEVAVIAREHGECLAACFHIECDSTWRTRRVEARVTGNDRRIALLGDGQGHWTDDLSNAVTHLDGAIDVDLPLTPFTNTLPIRRLDLGAGQSADLDVVYNLLPQFTIVTDPQRYVCIEPLRRYRYESRDSDFVRDIEVDVDGLFVEYPGLFRRLL